ncbi:MAG: hypothetical protein AAF614_10700 [Chloroflexota bacterium]
MKSVSRIIIVAVVALMAVAGATMAFAQEAPAVDAVLNLVQDEGTPEDGARGPRNGNGERNGGRNSELRELAMQIFDKDAEKAIVADMLGMTVEELDAAKEDGARLSELAEQAGVDVDSIKEAVQAYREGAVADAIADGTITEEQGEQLLNKGRRGGGQRGGGQRGGDNGPGAAEGQA